MIFSLVAIIIILLMIILKLARDNNKIRCQLKYIEKKLNLIMENNSEEKILLQTEDQDLRSLLISINRMLSYNQKVIATFNKSEISTRKMLANITHDLKTPLTVIHGTIEIMLYDTELSIEEREKLLKKVETKTIEVSELLQKFFDLAKLESGDIEIPLSRVNLSEVCKGSILSFYEVISAKNIVVDIQIPEKAIYSMGNDEALNRILNNLISNAIQYGMDGNVIGLTLREDTKYAFIDVWDKGKGISELHKDFVFERMYTLEDSRNKRYQGSGLGLTITKKLVEELGGEIFLNSKPYEKTEFILKFTKLNY
ncbi:signal transduction histidine kinase [Metabacillus crassostreae]|uniref:sensor histidine kinase n=1 Tax=Metabacillus crassostreae TaxID=929098 RepID=UPI00195DEF38|nr:sensor histidine kinase [Metabacillus crassostreae]MBM7605050.1 signal transduction histidine kinase [Metabacillus crassostreae]